MPRFLFAMVAAACSVAVLSGAEPPKKPNVVYIMADDLGWTDLACQGSKYYKTPHIDKLASSGLRFTNGYTCGPNCQPTRAALMSGQYAPRTGVYTVGGIDRFDWKDRPLRPVDNVQKLPLDRKTLGNVMTAAGYTTALYGKWHLGQDDQYHPGKRGFGDAITSMGKHFDFVTQPKVDYPKGTYLADFLTDKAVGFIEKNKSKPFFLCLHHFGVHSPHEAKSEWVEKFKDVPAAGGHRNPTYAAMIASVDESVGRVVAKLEELKLTENTLVIFTSDNGGVGGYVREGIKQGGDITDNAPLRSGKGCLYEGGVRVPWIARWPGTIPAGTTDTPVISVDLMPTLLELGGGKAPDKQPLDGVSMLECLKNGGKKAPNRDLFWHFPGYLGAGKGSWRTTPAGAIRSGDWKLIEFFEDGRKELYNLKDDESQKSNLAEKQPEKLKELHTKLVAWRKSVNAPMPTENKK
ncbi:MAG: sulfatase [Planctomycetes bacterium]|nr:sulfatase [Planctomycetota bacterium]